MALQLMLLTIAHAATNEANQMEAMLPPNGTYIKDPNKPEIQYYWSNTSGKYRAGLYKSSDSGTNWTILTGIFNFRKVYLHPETGVLYAIINYSWLDEGGEYLVSHSADKIIMSEDGKHWKNITRGPGYIADIVDIFQDPDHPKRICITTCIIRICVQQSDDDEYSNWKNYAIWTWKERHKEVGQSSPRD